MKSHESAFAVVVHDWFDRLGGLTPIHGTLHRSPVPMQPHHFDALEAAGIDTIFSLEECIPGDYARRRGFDWRPHFWTDNAAPTDAQLTRFLDDLARVPDDSRVLVHCMAGWGRAGTALACALVEREGWSSTRALDHLWSRVPGSENIMRRNRQSDYVHGWAARRVGRGLP